MVSRANELRVEAGSAIGERLRPARKPGTRIGVPSLSSVSIIMPSAWACGSS